MSATLEWLAAVWRKAGLRKRKGTLTRRLRRRPLPQRERWEHTEVAKRHLSLWGRGRPNGPGEGAFWQPLTSWFIHRSPLHQRAFQLGQRIAIIIGPISQLLGNPLPHGPMRQH